MSEHAIEITNLSRDHGTHSVLRNLNMQVKRGSVYGLLGRNGAGKTTLIKLLAGLIKPNVGEVRVLSGDPWTFGAVERQNLGYMSERQTLPANMTVKKLVAFCSPFYPAWDKALCDGLLRQFQINLDQKISTLSMGNQRLVGFILAIAPRPSVLLLDEPAANLDVFARREFLDEILHLAMDGEKTVIFSTHLLTDIERVADEIGILKNGALSVSESLDDLKETIKKVRLFDFQDTVPESLPGTFSFRREKNEIAVVLKITSPDQLENLATRLRCRYEVQDLALEDIFLHLA